MNGDIIIADYDNRWVSIFSPEGKFKTKIGAGRLMGPKGVAVDRNGHIIVVDNKACCVFIFQSNGKLVTKFGSRGTAERQFAGTDPPAATETPPRVPRAPPGWDGPVGYPHRPPGMGLGSCSGSGLRFLFWVLGSRFWVQVPGSSWAPVLDLGSGLGLWALGLGSGSGSSSVFWIGVLRSGSGFGLWF
ncbi:PREDICTED: protein lin-41-like [Calidris pugnax]|uniref:protein lin-41-like n=1 Tax=Calidris pugnax TaxID=198806 RepID=UPI00071D37EC|nr:PREDICTED: protein lin-41-like [Calidris pugnax]